MIWYVIVTYMAWTQPNLPPHPAMYKLGPYTLDTCDQIAKQEYKDIMTIGKMKLIDIPYCEMEPIPE